MNNVVFNGGIVDIT